MKVLHQHKSTLIINFNCDAFSSFHFFRIVPVILGLYNPMLCAALCHRLYQDFAESIWLHYDLQAEQFHPHQLPVLFFLREENTNVSLCCSSWNHLHLCGLTVLSQSSVTAAAGSQSEPLVCL